MYPDDVVTEECIEDLDAQKEYLRPETYSVVLVNDEVLEDEKFGEKSIKLESKLTW